ncbi:hypothetical protein HK101_003736 [Irineochytrium annulatum]|nr:hypothetical protein HK101_003736 [Irineochytrium annulatum]
MGVWAKGVGKSSVQIVANGLRRRPRARHPSGSKDAVQTQQLYNKSLRSAPIYYSSDEESEDGDADDEDVFEPVVEGEHPVTAERALKERKLERTNDYLPGSFYQQTAPSRLFASAPDVKRAPRRRTVSTGVLDLPNELLYEILVNLPTAALIPLLKTPHPLSTVTSSELSTRLHCIRTLADLRAFVHSPVSTLLGSPPTDVTKKQTFVYSSDLKEVVQSIGPLFYRAGTILMFARHFMRLIPEARALLGVGYAVVLAWFMCLFYAALWYFIR